MTSPRQEFVEAILRAEKEFENALDRDKPLARHFHDVALRRACVAFADALHLDITSSGPLPAPLSGEKLREKERATLLREVGLGECE